MKNRLSFECINYKNRDSAFESITKEQEKIGYYMLPEQDIQPILDYTETISDNIDSVAIIGIGGSSLGAKAIYEFIKPIGELEKKLYFFESTDPVNIHSTLDKIDLNRTHFFIISKSGTTIETFAVYKYIYSLQSSPKSYTFITDRGSPLDRYADEIGSATLYLPTGVGGRFSVLSVVGLAPLALCGINIKNLLKGALKIKNSFFKNGYIKDTILKKASFYATNHAKYHINCLFAYTESLKYFCEWYVQLWGESLGKRQRHSAFNVGLTPIGLIGPKDQHSFLQLIMEGTRDKSVTFIKVEDFQDKIEVPNITLPHLESLDCLNGISFSTLINLQCDSVVEALENEGDVPIDTITIPRIDEFNIGSLIFYYELLTSLVGELIDVDTYNQPGVEAGKIILKKKLN
ncbi:glucose-6-phosphate isomerase [Sulfurovum sp. bin170]|uniref:glucose-6-phosphate isomerase n=1 Tax=Sulfurovum sp. bin170 TaxID=2695268 RepID=UPI0013DE8812|nr:glucose-6-phosphate isomerase [Sulfurovum sp. bin170]NEW61217.1 glucose-6-phosphate isomerase [Sulfurovum sp. bin170]